MPGKVSGKLAQELMQMHMTLGGKIYGYYTEPVFEPRSSEFESLKIRGHALKISPPEATIISSIFSDFTDNGMSCKAIVKKLNSQLQATGKPAAPRGRNWHMSSLMGSKRHERGILRQELYAGIYKRKDITVDVPELRIISLPMWEETQKRLALATKVSRGKFMFGKPTYSRNLLTGILKCPSCLSNIAIVRGGRWPRYGCTNNFNSRGTRCANNLHIAKAELEAAFMEQLEGMVGPEEAANLRDMLGRNPVTGRAWLFEHVKNGYLVTTQAAWHITMELDK